MSTAWSWNPFETRALTAVDPNAVVAMQQPVPLPTVHHHTIKKEGNNPDNPIKIDAEPAAEANPSRTTTSKKRKPDSADSPTATGQDGGSAAVKRPRTSRTKKSSEGPARASSNTNTKKSQAEALLDVSSVRLEGEDLGPVPVYETCDTVRRKIRDVLKKDGVTQAGYCRALAGASPTTLDKPPQAVQLTRFLNNNTGPLGSNTSSVFYASYVLFEKMRVRDGKPKSKFRLEMEEVHGDDGVDTRYNMDTHGITLHVTERASYDKYGRIQITKGHAPMP